jgi:zinc and cadmium transporter
MLASGHSRTAAVNSAVVVAAATLAGVLVINFFPGWVNAGLPVAAGVALYVTATDLMPEVNREPGARMALVFFAGVAAFLVCKFVAEGILQ